MVIWRSARLLVPVLFLTLLALVFTGCKSSPPTVNYATLPGDVKAQAEIVQLREGDVLTIQFPGAPTLNTVQQIRIDGRIALPLVGELVAAGKTVSALEKEVLDLYSGKINTRQVNISVQSSSFTIYVTGAVLKQGKISSARPLSAFEAVMEAGVDHNKANLKKVKIIRTTKDRTEQFILDLQKNFKSGGGQPFMLKPGDVIFVPEKFVVFG